MTTESNPAVDSLDARHWRPVVSVASALVALVGGSSSVNSSPSAWWRTTVVTASGAAASPRGRRVHPHARSGDCLTWDPCTASTCQEQRALARVRPRPASTPGALAAAKNRQPSRTATPAPGGHRRALRKHSSTPGGRPPLPRQPKPRPGRSKPSRSIAGPKNCGDRARDRHEQPGAPSATLELIERRAKPSSRFDPS